MIYVTVGTMFLDFPRLILKMDEIAADTGERVVIQIGMGKTLPRHCEYFDFRPREDVLALQREARLVVCHAGIGSVSDALRLGRPLVVVPRLRRHKEHMNDHQLDLGRAVERRGWGRLILDVRDLPEACATPLPAKNCYAPAEEDLIRDIRDFISTVASRK
jgi:UDP-N-acetylglucosamine transferase subunit ALG13